jgi:glucans biosynthesis protein C
VILFGTVLGMPLFFAFAGYALWHSLGARGAQTLVRERLTRLLLPFLAGVVLLVPVQIYVARRLAGDDISYLQSVGQFLDIHLTLDFPVPVSGTWFDSAHLWFLAYLFAFTILVLPALVWLRRRPALPELSDRRCFAILVAGVVAVAGFESLLGTEAAGGWNRWTYLVFLVLGILVAVQPRLGELMARRWRLILLSAFASFLLLASALVQLQGELGHSLATGMAAEPLLWRAAKGATVLLFVMAVVGSCFQRAATHPDARPSAVVSYLQPISLPIYIVHQTILVVLAYWIVQWSLPVPTLWLSLVALTLAASIASVELAGRTRLGRLLLGMRPQLAEGPASRAQRPPAARPEPALASSTPA